MGELNRLYCGCGAASDVMFAFDKSQEYAAENRYDEHFEWSEKYKVWTHQKNYCFDCGAYEECQDNVEIVDADSVVVVPYPKSPPSDLFKYAHVLGADSVVWIDLGVNDAMLGSAVKKDDSGKTQSVESPFQMTRFKTGDEDA